MLQIRSIIPGPYNERKVDYEDFAFIAQNWLISIEEALGPRPEDGAISVVSDPDMTLSWRLGDLETEGYTVDYIVHLGTDQTSLGELDTVESTSYEVSGRFLPSTTYYWRIDTRRKLDSPPFSTDITPGNIWSFTTGS